MSTEKINEVFFPIVGELFKDHAEEIRSTSWKILEKFIEKCGKNTVNEKIWPMQKEKVTSKNYILRIASIKSMDFLKQYYDTQFLKDEVIPTIINQLKNDKVPNVRFTACKILSEIANFIESDEVKNTVKECVNQFINDEDDDVKYFSKAALEELK